MLFHSEKIPGAVMNRYGVVLIGSTILDPVSRAVVIREAKADGFVLVQAETQDIGLVWMKQQKQNE